MIHVSHSEIVKYINDNEPGQMSARSTASHIIHYCGVSDKYTFWKHVLQEEVIEMDTSHSDVEPVQDVVYWPSIGDWVLVNYEGDQFPDEVTAIQENETFEVSVMRRSGTSYRWPEKLDKIFYSREGIVILAPIVIGNRGQFQFTSL